MKKNNYELQGRRSEIEQAQRWQDEVARLPWIQFPADWKVKVIPPYGDAVVRFLVTLPDGREKSVYHDSRASLGMHFDDGEELIPYWEVYPVNGDVGRCGTDEVELLLEMITEGSEEKEETNMSKWITDRLPTVEDAPLNYVWTTINDRTGFSRWDSVKDGVPWMLMLGPDPYEKPKQYVVQGFDGLEGVVYEVYSMGHKACVAGAIKTREAAERIAAIYEEVKP